MAFYNITFECPDCAHTWKQRLGPADKWPRFCTGCGADMERPDDNFVPMAPSVITGVAGKSGDQVFRMMEASSEQRIEAAAAQLGLVGAQDGEGVVAVHGEEAGRIVVADDRRYEGVDDGGEGVALPGGECRFHGCLSFESMDGRW